MFVFLADALPDSWNARRCPHAIEASRPAAVLFLGPPLHLIGVCSNDPQGARFCLERVRGAMGQALRLVA